MIEWIKSFFVVKEKQQSRPKCSNCGLGAKYLMLVEFKTIDLKEIEDKKLQTSL